MDFLEIIKMAWRDKVKGIGIMSVCLLLSLLSSLLHPVNYKGYVDFTVIRNFSFNIDSIPQWINSPEILDSVDDCNTGDKEYDVHVKKSLQGIHFMVEAHPGGARIYYIAATQEEVYDALETLKYHIQYRAQLQNKIINEIYSIYDIPMNNEYVVMNGVYCKTSDPVISDAPLPRKSIWYNILAGVCIASFIILLLASRNYLHRNK